MRRRALIFSLPLLLAATACGDLGYGLDGRDVEGTYALNGEVYGEPAHSIIGTLRLEERRGELEAWLDWRYREGAYTVVEIETDRPARVDSNGWDRLDFALEGELWTGSRWVDFRLEHEGRVERRVIRGTWRLETDLGTVDRGGFVARR